MNTLGVLKGLCVEFGVKQIRSRPYRPQTQGKVLCVYTQGVAVAYTWLLYNIYFIRLNEAMVLGK